MKLKIKCLHTGCNKDHSIDIDIGSIPKMCGVLDCNRKATARIRSGYSFYEICEVCLTHAQGQEIK